MELFFVRHGETEFNKHHQLMGQRINAPLDSEGEEQAKQVLEKLPSDFSMIYSSPLKRAAQTAQVISEHFKKEIVFKDELLERDFGSLSGKSWHDIDTEVGKPLSEADKNLTYDYTEYGGEAVSAVKARLEKFLNELKAKHSNDKVVVVTHFGIISIMDDLYPKQDHEKLSNISIHKFVI